MPVRQPHRRIRSQASGEGRAIRLTGILLATALLGMVTASTGSPSTGRAAPAASAGPVTVGSSATVGGTLRSALALRALAEELRPVSYRPPVDGRVVRPFERPMSAYGPGHRGVDLDAQPGVAVRAADRGRVHHAGSVAGVVWVSIDHADGVRTSYGPLTDLRVRAGDDVVRGEVIGVLDGTDHGDPEVDRGLHLGARRDGDYLDPMLLPGMASPRPTLVGAGGWWGAGHMVTPYDPWRGGRLAGVLTTPSPQATTPGFAVPPNSNHLMLVAGLSSTRDRKSTRLNSSH
jgi:murein DD-endopeptidase MepM/ murein hydrolase activator NlpD